MPRPYSNDLRERVVAAVASGRPCREVAVLFGVSVASVVKWSQRHRATGTAAAQRMGGHRKRLLAPYRVFLLERLATVPDLTMPALVAELAELGVMVHPVTVWRLLRSEGLRFKKNAVRHRAGSTRDRAAPSTVESVSGSD